MVQYKVYTNVGSRENNEDRFKVARNGESYCFVIADGLGGHGYGEVAAQIAVDEVDSLFIEQGYSESFFENAFNRVQMAILNRQEEKSIFSEMKTTLVILVLHEKKAYWAHIGDSRLYVFQSKKIKLRTIDHSVAQMLALSGEIKEKEIRHHPDRNRLMRVLGVKGEKPRYECGVPMKLRGFQSFLLCTDGYWELIEEKDMEGILQQSSSVEEWIIEMNRMVAKAGENTDMDNFTAIVVAVQTKSFFGR